MSTMPTQSRKVKASPNIITPIATAVSGSRAPKIAVGVAPTSCTAMVMNNSDSTVGTNPNQQAKNHARGDGGSIRCRSEEVKE